MYKSFKISFIIIISKIYDEMNIYETLHKSNITF